jgi:hypothetical protein
VLFVPWKALWSKLCEILLGTLRGLTISLQHMYLQLQDITYVMSAAERLSQKGSLPCEIDGSERAPWPRVF